MADAKIYLPTKEQVDTILSTIGNSSDSGGSVSAGTMNAKINNLISTLGVTNAGINDIVTNQGVAWEGIVSARDNAYQANINSSTANTNASNANTNAYNASTKIDTLSGLIGGTSDTWVGDFYDKGTLMNKINYLVGTIRTQSVSANVSPFHWGTKAIKYNDYTWNTGSSSGSGTQRINYNTSAVTTSINIKTVFGISTSSVDICIATMYPTSSNQAPIPLAAYMESTATVTLIAPRAASDNNSTILLQFYRL